MYLCLVLLTSCSATKPEIRYITVTKDIVVSPGESLLADCHLTPWTKGSFRDLSKAFKARGNDIKVCNEDKAALRRFFQNEQRKAGEKESTKE